MSGHDPTAALLGGIGRPVDPRPEFADGLLERLLVELERPRRSILRARTLLVAAALLLLLVGVATATYLVERPHAAAVRPKPGSLTIADSPGNGVATIVEVLSGGRTRVVWRCPGGVFCGELTSLDWAPGGRLVAFTLDEIGGLSTYVGLHIVGITTGRDLHIPSPTRPQDFIPEEQRRLGCAFPTEVSWSPNGHRLAYACAAGGGRRRPAIFTIASDGKGATELKTGLRSVGWPGWSPDGKRIAFSGNNTRATGRSSLYVVNLDGSGRRRIALDATAPSWSPDGKTIAYDSSGGVRLVTPSGADVTPRRGPIAPAGLPAWSPDGTTIAVGTSHGVYLVDPSGTHLRRVTSLNGQTPAFGPSRPAWYPGPTTFARRPACKTCL